MKQLKEAMEDGVTETVSFLHPEQEEEDHHHQDTAPGLLNHIFSNLVYKGEASEEKQEEEEEGKGGGILNNLISHLVTPSIDPKAGETSQGDEVDDKKGKEEDELVVKIDEDSGGGVIDKIVSHFPGIFFSPSNRFGNTIHLIC